MAQLFCWPQLLARNKPLNARAQLLLSVGARQIQESTTIFWIASAKRDIPYLRLASQNGSFAIKLSAEYS